MVNPILRRITPGLVALALLHAAPVSARVYCCKDASGVQVCGDVLPASCADRSYRELNRQGATVKQVDAPLTPAQRAKRDADAQKAAENERVRQEQRRRAATLLNTYASEADIESARARRVADLDELLRQLRDQEQTLIKRQGALEAEKARLGKKPVYQGLKDRLETNTEDMRRIAENISGKERDLAETKTRFDQDLVRFRALKGGQP